MKISEITIDNLKQYMRVDDAEEDSLIASILLAGKLYIKGYTGLNDSEMDNLEDLTLALYVICAEMYDNRQYTQGNTNVTVNPIVQSILDMHSINLL